MNRLKLLAMATLMALTFTACDEGTPPPVEPEPPPDPVGTISGTVTIDGSGAAGLTATLSSGATQTTNTSGAFSFADVLAGSYTVTISGHPEDVTFPAATQSATIASNGQTVQLNFPGQYIRSSSVVGNVVASDAMMSATDSDGQPDVLAGVTVTLTGDHAMAEPQQTDMSTGGYAFTGLRAGTYTVEISGFPEDVAFDEVSMTVEVGVGDVGKANFEGAYIRTAAVEGRVIIEGEGLAGVMVTLVGGPGNDSYTKTTGANGEYAFTELRPGDYQVSISGYDPEDYEFASNSHDVSVDLEETETVTFTGVLLRTSGISGRVSVEGMGLPDIAVTLSGAADASAMTDASGQYAFAGLAAGDYTVSIAVESEAYVFESMSSDVSVADDATEIVNFEGSHATTASVSGMLFIDELDKNDAYDEGEAPLPAPGVPVALVGPGVNDQRLSQTNAEGQFMFPGLRAGPYQLIVPITADVAAALAAKDLAYGGPATGYPFALGVGEARTQAVPFDITHTTINVAVTLKGGEYRGMPIPGASVTLYSDAGGETRVGSGETEASDAGVFTSIRVARAGTSGNTVHMAVSAEGYFADPTAGMQAVTWNPQSPVHPMPGADPPAVLNDADIVNLNVDVTVSGATVTTDYGGGEALGDWVLSVTSGGEAVDGAPPALDTAGTAAFTATVAPADLPVSYSFNVADDQANSLDGGESFEGSAAEYMHNGLALAGTVDLDPIEVRYTTQTLRVYVHREVDQVFGLTGNIVGGDGGLNMNPGSVVELEIEYEEGGRDHSFESDEWDADLNTQYSNDVTVDGPDGDTLIMGHRSTSRLVVFRHLPADKDIFVSASVVSGAPYMVLDRDPHDDQLDTFRNLETNGVVGGAFGAQGGFSSRVSLCPLQEKNPQNFDACSSFAIVSLHTVTGDVSMRDVKMERNGDDFEVDPANDPTFVPDFTVSLVPKEGENFGGERVSFTTAEDDDDDTPLNEESEFEFEDVVAGAYSVVDPSGWGAPSSQRGDLDPLGSDDVHLTIRPTTHTFYGHVVGADDFAVDSVTVNVNGQSAMTDEAGRYIIKGINRVAYYNDDDVRVAGYIWSTARAGQNPVTDTLPDTSPVDGVGGINPNDPYEFDIDLTSVGEFASVSGTVRASGSNAPIAGALVEVNYGSGWVAPTNPNAKSDTDPEPEDDDIYETGSDGTYSIEVEAQGLGGSVSVRVTMDNMSFVPGMITSIPAHAGSAVTGFDFTGFLHARISGKVEAPGGGPLSGVKVTATRSDASAPAAEATTGRTGSFTLSVPFGTYTVEASLASYNFTYPTQHPGGIVNTAPGQRVNMGTIKATTAGALSVSAARQRVPDNDQTATEDESVPTRWGANIMVTYTADAEDVPAGYRDATYEIQTNTGTENAWVDASDTDARDADDAENFHRFTIANPEDGEFMVRVVATAIATNGGDPLVLESAPATVDAINPAASGVSARRQAAEDSEEAAADGDFIHVSWSAVTNANSAFRVVAQVSPASTGGSAVWVVLNQSAITGDTRMSTREFNDTFSAGLNVATATGTGSSVTVTAAEINAAIMVAVESVQGDASEDNEWKRSAAAELAAKPAADNGG